MRQRHHLAGQGREGSGNSTRKGDRRRFCLRHTPTVWLVAVALTLSIPATTAGQLVGETINLQSGWNAVWFNIQPEPSEIAAFLASQAPPLDCQAIWAFEPNRNVTFDPAADGPGRWHFYDQSVPPSLHTLRSLQGNRAYLFKVNVGGSLRLTGNPVIRPIAFSGRVSNLFGATSDPFGPTLTFEKFFAHPSAAGKIASAGAPERHDVFSITDTGFSRGRLIDPIEPNRAYWINVVQDFQYAGPLDVTSNANGLSFGTGASIRTLVIELPAAPVARTVNVRARPCTELDGSTCSAAATGAEWLEYRIASESPIPEWQPLTIGHDVLVPAGATKLSLDLRAKRTNVAAVSRLAGGSGALPPLVVEVADGQGSLAVIPADAEVEPIFGLWAGKAVLTKVGVHPGIQDTPFEQAAAPPLVMTLILNLPAPADIAQGTVPQLLDTVTIQAFRDGRNVQRRFSAVLFDRPVSLEVDAGDPVDPIGTTGTLRGTIHIQPEDPLNPYRHRYHPEHRKGFEILRDITIQLTAGEPSLADVLTGLDGTFGPHLLSGTYTEVITGLSVEPITVGGSFRLERIRDGAGGP